MTETTHHPLRTGGPWPPRTEPTSTRRGWRPEPDGPLPTYLVVRPAHPRRRHGAPGDALRQKLTEWRNTGYLSLAGTGLVAITRVLYEPMKEQEPEWQPIVDRMAHIDWRRTNTKSSRGVVTPDRAKVNTGYAASMEAAGDIKRMIGWTPSHDAPRAEADLLATTGEAA